ncbi:MULTISPECIES: helix-turn-helix domain-containing protein [unclassified Desulfovibrio]|uniref:helix-turn-helix domain-containing protein n=1 Tax=unclassified Desulfovibrio TaxID=2593640 RepID=UPI0009FDCA10
MCSAACAWRALLRADTAAAEAAVSAGFTDQSHLHKLFRRQHGMTSEQFRRASLRLEA